MAMKWGCAMRNIGQKYAMDPDLEIHDDYQGVNNHIFQIMGTW